jgi:site-specific recombinase
VEKILLELAANRDEAQAPQLLRALVNKFRPPLLQDKHYAEARLSEITTLLNSNRAYCEGLQRNILSVVHKASFTQLFSETGIITKNNFWSEFSEKISYKILPPVEEEQSIHRQLQYIFHERNDFKWVEEVDIAVWNDFFNSLRFDLSKVPHQFKTQMFNALKILSYRIAALGLEKEITGKISDTDELLSPFLSQNKEVYDLVMLLSTGLSAADIEARFDKINLLLVQCEANLNIIKQKALEGGTSLHQTFIISRISQMLQRMRIIIDFMDDAHFDMSRLVHFFRLIIHHTQNKSRLREFISENIAALSYQIAEHKSTSGEHYIASNRKEYLKFFYSACGGGIIISFIVIFKILIHHAGYAPFWEAIAYSLNYAFGFILIHITGSTLATKQPAMTASTIARMLDVKASGTLNNDNIINLIAKVISTQTISFVGNLLLVFMLTVLLIMGIEYFSGENFVGYVEAQKMLDANNPLRSLVWFYAGITGVFLFISGIISGYYDNKVIYDKIPERLRHHPQLKKMMPEGMLNRFADYMDHNLGSLVGNLMLGFFLGTATFIGEILGWYYDIRHITISSGYFSIGVYQNFILLPWWEIALVFIGVIGVGFINFLVSFSLALYVALRSRKVSVDDYGKLISVLIGYVKNYPFDFIFPPKNDRTINDR